MIPPQAGEIHLEPVWHCGHATESSSGLFVDAAIERLEIRQVGGNRFSITSAVIASASQLRDDARQQQDHQYAWLLWTRGSRSGAISSIAVARRIRLRCTWPF